MPADVVYLPEEIEAGATVKLHSMTEIQQGDDASEHRVPRWPFILREWHLSYGPEYVDDVEDMFESHLGPSYSFLFRPPRIRDYTVTNSFFGLGDGTTTSFQLARTKTVGVRSGSMPVLHPRADTLLVYLNGSPTTAYTLGSLGMVVFTSPPGSGVIISASFEYDSAVRFAEDALETTFQSSFKEDGATNADIIAAMRSVTLVEVPGE